MEPFELSLNQVNFEDEPFGESDELDSFSNLVCYDSDFKQNSPEGLPIRSRRIEQYEVADSFHCSQVNHLARVMDDSKIGIGSVHIVPVAKDVVPEERQKELSSELCADTAHKTDVTKISDSFKAFTETVEALALQKSVIGKRNVVPASADEVARVVAATRARLNNEHDQKLSASESMTSVSKESDADSVTTLDNNVSNQSLNKLPGTESASFGLDSDASSPTWTNVTGSDERVAVATHDKLHLDATGVLNVSAVHDASRIHDTEQVVSGNLSGKSVSYRKITMAETSSASTGGPATEALPSVSQQGTSVCPNSAPKGLEGKELIRISAKEISTATKKSPSSWFWSKSSSEVTPSKQGPVRKSQTTKSPDVEDGSVEKNLQKRPKKKKVPTATLR